MTTNEEIIADMEGYDPEEIAKALNLARADERKSYHEEYTLNHLKDIEQATNEGYNIGCLETKEKILREIQTNFSRYVHWGTESVEEEGTEKEIGWDWNDGIKIIILKSEWDKLLSKELSCPEVFIEKAVNISEGGDIRDLIKDEGEKE